MTTNTDAWAGLTPAHTAMLAESAVSREVAEARGYRTVTDKDELTELGFTSRQAKVPGILIPLYSPGALRSEGKPTGYQFRPDEPRTRDGKPIKYETPQGQASVIDLHPTALASAMDASVPLYITEGAKKADAGTTLGLTMLQLQGVWNWRSKGGTALSAPKDAVARVSPDLDELPLTDRIVYIVFDSDVIDKEQVGRAVQRLASVLTRRGAKVRVMRLPDGPGGEKVGLDDYIAAGGQVGDHLVDVGLTQEADSADDDRTNLPDAIRRMAEERYDFGQADNYGLFAVDREGPNVAIPLDASFKHRLAAMWTDEVDDTPSVTAVSAAWQTLIGRAEARAEQPALPVRMATMDDGTLVIDMGDHRGRAVLIRPGEWEVVDRSPVLFRRGGAMKPLPLPKGGGDPFKLLAPFVRAEEEDTHQLAVAWAASVGIEWMQHPIIYVTGPSGSGKTQTALWMKQALDPSAASFQRFQNERDNLVAASATWSFMYDNIGVKEEKDVPFWDFTCGLVTGTGYTTRALYTNLDTVSVNLRRCILMTSVEELSVPEDAAERMIHWDVPDLRGGGRSSLYALEKLWDERHADIVGALLDMIANAMLELDPGDSNGLEGLRFTDFAAFLRAVDNRYGTSTLHAYRDMLVAAVADRAAVSPFVGIVVDLVRAHGGYWEGEPKELLQAISAVAAGTGQGTAVPDSAEKVGRMLSREASTLRSEGVTVATKRVQGRRVKVLTGPQGDGSGPEGDGTKPLLSPLLSPSMQPVIPGSTTDSSSQGDSRTVSVEESPKGESDSDNDVAPTTEVERGSAEPTVTTVTFPNAAQNDGPHWVTVVGDGSGEGDSSVTQLAFDRTSESVMAELGTVPLTPRTLRERLGLTETRIKRSLSYLASFGVVEEVKRQEHELEWAPRSSKGWVRTDRAWEAIDRSTHNRLLAPMDSWTDTVGSGLLIDRPVTVGCHQCREAYELTHHEYMHSCPKCQHTGRF